MVNMSDSILKISEASIIALHAMMELAINKDKLLSVKEIAEKLDISANHLSKVLQRLCKAGFVESVKGFNGGFKICINPAEHTFMEIYEIFDGKLKDANCLLHKVACKENCIFGELISSINVQVREKFENTTLAELIV